MYSNWFLYGIYSFLKGLTRLCLALFYPDTRVTGKEHLHLKGPTLLITNHPNTLLDALNGAARVNEQVFFLVNSSLFSTPFLNWFFNTFFCIPIERPQDTNGRPINNKEAFARCDEHLGRGGHIFIAPEGTSVLERRLRPFKTGVSRIGLSAENAAGFRLGVRVLPVGLNYQQAESFGSELLVNVGAPVYISDFQSVYDAHPREAVRQLTELLERTMRELIIDTKDDREDRLVQRLEIILQNNNPKQPEEHFYRTKLLIANLRHRALDTPAVFQRLEENTDQYFKVLESENLNDQIIAEASGSGRVKKWNYLVGLVLGFPVFLYGLVNNYLPYFIPKWVAAKLNLYIGYEATVKILMGLLTFPLFYWLQIYAVTRWTSWPWPFIYFISLIPSGYFAHWYPKYHQEVRQRLQWRRWEKSHREDSLELIRLRGLIGQEASQLTNTDF